MKFCKTPKFQLGTLAATPGAISAMAEGGCGPEALLRRHQTGDWGDVCQEDKELNDAAISCEGDCDNQQRVLSVYEIGKTTLWVITEWDRSITTILRPNEY